MSTSKGIKYLIGTLSVTFITNHTIIIEGKVHVHILHPIL